jgi:hypothetical protein
MIDKALSALASRDFKAFAACFSSDGRYFDYCPSCNGKDNYFVYGQSAIEMFFGGKFEQDLLTVSDPVVEADGTASFFGAYEGPYVLARFCIDATDGDGLIKRAVVHPM